MGRVRVRKRVLETRCAPQRQDGERESSARWRIGGFVERSRSDDVSPKAPPYTVSGDAPRHCARECGTSACRRATRIAPL